MNLNDMANFVCSKVRMSEAEDVAAAKGFLKRRHEMIWNESLWKDSLCEYTQTLSPSGYTVTSNWLPSLGVLLLPPIIEKVLAVRTDTRRLNVQRPEYYYGIDYDAFAKTGAPAEFILLPPCVWQFQEAQSLYLARGDSGDSGAVVNVDTLDSDGVSVTRSAKTLTGELTAIASTSRIDRITKLATTGSVSVSNGTISDVIAEQTAYGTSGDSYNSSLTLSSGSRYSFTLGNATGLSRIVGFTVMESYTADATFIAGDGTYLLSGPEYDGPLPMPSVIITAQVTGAADIVAALSADDTSIPLRQRIRLVTIPGQSLSIRVLGKRSCPAFENNSDEPAISGVTNALLAFAQADMLQSVRQYGKADMVAKEGLALLDQLKSIETVQQAHHQRLIPSDGYGNDELYSTDGLEF